MSAAPCPNCGSLRKCDQVHIGNGWSQPGCPSCFDDPYFEPSDMGPFDPPRRLNPDGTVDSHREPHWWGDPHPASPAFQAKHHPDHSVHEVPRPSTRRQRALHKVLCFFHIHEAPGALDTDKVWRCKWCLRSNVPAMFRRTR